MVITTTYEFSHSEEPTRRSNNMGNCTLVILGILFGIAALLIVILVPMSYADLEYYEMGFSKHKTSGKVDTNKVYYGGRHWIGVMYTFKKYPADIQTLNFNQIEIFNQENIKITLTAAVHYKLNPKYLKYLHDTYDLQYEKVLEATAVSALKSAAPSFKVDEYRLERAKVAEGLKKSINRALGGNCCPLKNCTGSTLCEPDCVPYENCTKDDRGIFMELMFFQLQNVDLTKQQEIKYLNIVLEQELKDTEQFKQDELVRMFGLNAS